MTEKGKRGVIYRTVGSNDEKYLVNDMVANKLGVMGVCSPSLFRLLIGDAVRGRGCSIVVAELDGERIAWAMSITNHRNYWIRFILRAPLLGIEIVFITLYRFIRTRTGAKHHSKKGFDEEYDWPISEDLFWGLSSPSVARLICIRVAESYRRMGIGSELQDYHFHVLSSCGVRQVDTLVHLRNAPSIEWHRKRGWRLVDVTGNNLLVSKVII